jgi:multiple sugar transport system substrate-binding protein
MRGNRAALPTLTGHRSGERRFEVKLFAALALTAAVALSGCGGSSSGSSGSSNAAKNAPAVKTGHIGGNITVAVAYPSPPASALAQFTSRTGVKVNWVNVGWDDLQSKIVAASTAHSYFADVTDVDWSKVGEYARLGWFYPLNRYFSVSALGPDMPQLSTFVDNGELVGLPMDSSFLVSTMNMPDLKKAGITTLPKTLSEYTADLQQMKKKGVIPHPLNVPLQAQEGLSTYWYETTAAFGGHVLTPDHKAAFTSPSSPGYKALAWIVNAYKSGLIPPGNVNMADYAALESDMAHNITASSLSEYSGDVATIYNLHNVSKVVGQVEYIPTPSVSGSPAPNLGNPDGVGIPRTAHNVAGAVAFIKWLDQPQNQALWAGANGGHSAIVGFPLPAENSGTAILAKSLHGSGGIMELSKLLKTSQPVFENGAPPWYSQFSNAVNTNIHAAAAGQESIAGAIQAIAQVVQSQSS